MKLFKKIIEFKDKKFALIREHFYGPECNIEEPHAHRFVNAQGFTKYIQTERRKCNGYVKQEDYILLNEKNAEVLSYLNRNGLIRISDNIDRIRAIQSRNKGFYKYEYEYTHTYTVPIFEGTGKDMTVRYKEEEVERTDWTRDIYHDDLTGYRRWYDYEYTSFRVVRNKKGKYSLEFLDGQKDVIANMNVCPYIKEDFYDLVHYKAQKVNINEERAKLNHSSKRHK